MQLMFDFELRGPEEHNEMPMDVEDVSTVEISDEHYNEDIMINATNEDFEFVNVSVQLQTHREL